MKTYISYVVQDNIGHNHHSEVLESKSPPYSYSGNPPVEEIIKWEERKRKELKKDENIIITGMFKL